MRLSFVKLRAPEKLADGSTTDELRSDMVGEIDLDLKTRLIHVKDDFFPIENVRKFNPLVREFVCPECAVMEFRNVFLDSRGLGAHRYFKHGVPSMKIRRQMGNNNGD